MTPARSMRCTRSVQLQRLLGMCACFGMLALARGYQPDTDLRGCLAALVCHLLEQAARPGQVAVSLVQGAEHGKGLAKVAVDVRLACRVSLVFRGRQRDFLNCDAVMPAGPPVDEGVRGPGKLPGVPGETASRRLGDGRHQGRVFGQAPRPGGGGAGEAFGEDPGLGRHQRDRVAGSIRQPVGGAAGVQVVIEYPVQRRSPFSLAAARPG
jgi:hypothetical protein